MAVLQERLNKLNLVSVELEQTKTALEDKKLELENLNVDYNSVNTELSSSKTRILELGKVLDIKNQEITKLSLIQFILNYFK